MESAFDVLLEIECEKALREVGYEFDEFGNPIRTIPNIPQLEGEWEVKGVFDYIPGQRKWGEQRQLHNIAVPVKRSFKSMWEEYQQNK